MANSSLRVSIGLPVYNGGRYLPQALDSLLAQDFEGFELIISDNASTDATQQICLEYASKDKRIRYYRNPTNVGAAGNFNRVFELSSGRYFMWAAHDDLWSPSYIASCLEALEKNASVVLCYGLTSKIGPNGESLGIVTGDGLHTIGLPIIDRVRRVLWGTYYFPVYGLMRAAALRQTRLCQNVRAPDVILLFELSLLGEFALTGNDVLFYTRLIDKSAETRLAEIDPSNESRAPRFLALNMMLNALRGVRKSSIPFPEKVRVSLEVLRWGTPAVDEAMRLLPNWTRLALKAPLRMMWPFVNKVLFTLARSKSQGSPGQENTSIRPKRRST